MKRSHKTGEIKVFLLFLLNVRRIQEAQKHVDPGDLDSDSDPDPDPQHCSYVHIEFFRP